MTVRQFLTLFGICVFVLLTFYFFGFIKPNENKVKFIEKVPKTENVKKVDEKKDDAKDTEIHQIETKDDSKKK